MKAKDKTTGQFKKVYVKALDSLPVGTELDFDGSLANLPEGWVQVENPEEYLPTEVKTNKTWIDGKPIYRKIFTFNSLANSSDNTLGTISNLDYVVSLSGIANQSGEKLTLPHSDYRGLEWSYSLLVNNNSVTIRKGSFGTVTGASHVIVEYTKTTD